MFFVKFQAGCLLISLYFIFEYIKGTYDQKIKCSRIFDIILYVSPWAIVFDGITAATVNYMDVVPQWLNLLLHFFFLAFMTISINLFFIYVVSQVVQIREKKFWVLLVSPSIISIIGLLRHINSLYFVQGKTTWYSMGIPVYICYGAMLIQFLTMLVLVSIKHKQVEKHKLWGLLFFIFLGLVMLVFQCIFPEILISAILPTVAVIGIYMNFEDPSLKKIIKFNNDMVADFATLVENRDNSTGGHIKRTQGYVGIILDEMRRHPKYVAVTSRDYIENVTNAAPLHDIGKISTPDVILTKPGKLTDEEYDIMKQHAAVGGDIVKKIYTDADNPEYAQIVYEVARNHHEKWNGRGYPDGLQGEDIPLHARIMAIADVFDAVSAKRCYRNALPLDVCFKIIKEGRGTDFDPNLVDIFMDAKERISIYYSVNRDEDDGE